MHFTPYLFITSVFARFGLFARDSKQIKQYLRQAKLLLDKLRSMGWDDSEILQMVDYTCTGIIKRNLPRNFNYFSAVMFSFCTHYVQSENISVNPDNVYKDWINREIEKLSNS